MLEYIAIKSRRNFYENNFFSKCLKYCSIEIVKKVQKKKPIIMHILTLLLFMVLSINIPWNSVETATSLTENATPIIGILTQEVSKLIYRKYPDKQYTSYLAASYVKFVESGGGRVIPIW